MTNDENCERPSVLFLSSGPSRHNDNFERIPAAFERAGWNVANEAHESVALDPSGLRAGARLLAEYDLVWPIGFGDYQTFHDRAQLLKMLPQDKLITRIDAWLSLHGKTAFLEYCPPTSIAARPQPLLDIMAAQSGDWVLKPCGGSFGRDVHFVSSDARGRQRIKEVMRNGDTFYLLQRYVPEILDGETRTLVAGGRLIASYLRTPTCDIRANVALDARVSRSTLAPADASMVAEIAAKLQASGVGFAAVDTVAGRLVEVNIANPGGLATLDALYGHDFTDDLVGIVTQALGA